MAHGGKTTNSSGWNAVFSWIKYALTGKRDETKAVSQSSVSASSLVDLDARVKAIEKVLASLDVDDAEDLSVYKILQAAKTFSPDRTKTLSAMSQDANGEMSATFAEVQATVVSQNDYTSPDNTKTPLSTIFGKIWNFFGMLLKSTGTWNGSSDAQIPTTAAVQAKLDKKQDKFVALVGESGANDGSLFNDIKSAWSKNQDIVARRVVSGTENALFQLVKTIFTNGEVSGFVFQRSFPDDAQAGTYARGQLEQWTRTASKWQQNFLTVEYADHCVEAVTADIATSAVTANDYSNSGTIKTALDSKQNAYELTIGTHNNNDGTSFSDIGAAYTQNKRLTVRKVENTYISYFELIKVEFSSGSPSKFIFQRSYPEQVFVNQQTTFLRGQLEQWSRTSSKWEQMFVPVEIAEQATLAVTATNYTGGNGETIKTALDSKMSITATALLSPSGSGMIASYISPTLLCIMPEVLRYTGSGNPHGQVLGTDTDMRTWINIEKFIDWAVSAPYRKSSGQIYAILNYSGSNIMFTTGNAVGYGNTFLSINDEMFFVCFYNTEYHILDV